MSTYVTGFTSENDPTYQKHKKVLLACKDADVSLPEETKEYFGESEAEEWVLEQKLVVHIPMQEWSDEDCREGFELLVKDIPEGVYKIRFVTSY